MRDAEACVYILNEGSAKRLRKKDIFCVKSLIIMTLATKFKQSNLTSTFIIHPLTETIAKQMGGVVMSTS